MLFVDLGQLLPGLGKIGLQAGHGGPVVVGPHLGQAEFLAEICVLGAEVISNSTVQTRRVFCLFQSPT